MRFVDDMTQPEIAEALNLPLGTVKSRLHHAISRLDNFPISPIICLMTADRNSSGKSRNELSKPLPFANIGTEAQPDNGS